MHPGIHPTAWQADLVARTEVVQQGAGGQGAFVGPPSHFRQRGRFLVAPLDTPSIDELIRFLWQNTDLRISLANVNDSYSEQLRQLIEGSFIDRFRDCNGARGGWLLVEDFAT